MKLLLSSSGISNQSIAEALAVLVSKKPEDTKVGFVPIAANVQEGNKDWYINQFVNLWRYGFNYVDIVDPTAADVDWKTRLEDMDVIFVSGGNTFHLLNQYRQTGFDKWLETNKNSKVYVGVSAGTIIMTPTIEIANLGPNPDPNLPRLKDLTAMRWVDFEVEPHCDQERFKVVEKHAKSKKTAIYAIDDQTAIKVIDGLVEVVTEGSWKLFNR